MKILEIPFLVEIFFVVSTLVFLASVYAILPALIYKKRTLFKPKMINSLWQRFFESEE
jgi:hypothetical protein